MTHGTPPKLAASLLKIFGADAALGGDLAERYGIRRLALVVLVAGDRNHCRFDFDRGPASPRHHHTCISTRIRLHMGHVALRDVGRDEL